jgi:predicted nuclease of predicted toxin-antitoxin system
VRLKLDENLGRSAVKVLVHAGHDVATVVGQGIPGARDEQLFRLCIDEGRALVTLDLDFSNPLRFDPTAASGIVVLRVPEPPGLSSLLACARRLAIQLETAEVAGRLWIVEADRVREYEPGESDPPGADP